MQNHFDFLSAYYSPDMADESGVTIMVNQYFFLSPNNKDHDLTDCICDNEESFEGGNIMLAEEICNEFNKLKTKNYDDFHSVRDNVWKSHNFKLS